MNKHTLHKGDLVDIGGSLEPHLPRITQKYQITEEPIGAYAKVARLFEPGELTVYMGRWFTLAPHPIQCGREDHV